MNSPVLITGASQRLGLAMADSLLEQGHHVVVTYRTPRSSITMLEDKGATVLQADFSTEAAMIEQLMRLRQSVKPIEALYTTRQIGPKKKTVAINTV